MIKGWNAENRLVIGRGVKPGQTIQLAIFGANGPISQPPTNYIWMRYAPVGIPQVPAGPVAVAPHEVNVNVERVDPAIDAIVPLNPKIFKLAEGFQFTEGPIWTQSGDFLFSDPNANTIYKYGGDGKLSVFKTNSGYSGKDIGEYFQPGSNGLTLDPQGRLTINEHGNHRVARIEKDGRVTVLADSTKASGSTGPTISSTAPTARCSSPIRRLDLPKFYDDPAQTVALQRRLQPERRQAQTGSAPI